MPIPATWLRHELQKLSALHDDSWFACLEERKVREAQFHDRDRDEAYVRQLSPKEYRRFKGNKRFYRVTRSSESYVRRWIQDHAVGRIVLDYACGEGRHARMAARAGAELAIGIDLSRVSIEKARRLAAEEGLVNNTLFLPADCEDTGFPDGCVDVVLAMGVLHHLDLRRALPELQRIVKPGGVVFALEALKYNPFIGLYRRLTLGMRTRWEAEHILGYEALRLASKFFHVRDVRHWHLFSIGAAYAPSLLPALDRVDALVLRIPGLKKMSWMFSFELHKVR